MQLTKHHGLGNDFCVAFVDEVPPRAPAVAQVLCHRSEGVGADGMIFATPGPQGVDLTMHLFNADGSAAAISGNGIRCLAQAAWARQRGLDAGARLSIESAGRRYVLELTDWSPPTAQIAVSMGAVEISPDAVAMVDTIRPDLGVVRVATASVGNPHVVLEVDDLEQVDVAVDGPAIEAHWLPEGINVHFVVASGPDRLQVLHWERGAGVTAACGSGATVCATVARQWGLVGDRVAVDMPGGRAEVLVGADATLIGPAVVIATIGVDDGAVAGWIEEASPGDPDETMLTGAAHG